MTPFNGRYSDGNRHFKRVMFDCPARSQSWLFLHGVGAVDTENQRHPVCDMMLQRSYEFNVAWGK